MLPLLLIAFASVLAQSPSPTLEQRTFKAPDGSLVRYGVAVPGDYDKSRPRPLVVALHPGGGGSPFYGDGFMRNIFLPGLRELAPIMIAPDAPAQTWTDARAEQAVLALMTAVLADRRGTSRDGWVSSGITARGPLDPRTMGPNAVGRPVKSTPLFGSKRASATHGLI